MTPGRPLEYTQEMGDHICELVSSTGHGLTKLCKLNPELPSKETIRRWRYRVPSFRVQYAQAKLTQADILAEECLDIADEDYGDTKINPVSGEEVCNTEFIARSRLRIDTRKWLAAKLLPRQYGQAAEEDKQNDKSIVVTIVDRLSE
jgi:hypothetical protein